MYNYAAHYRQSVFELIDRNYQCDWFFGKSNSNIKKMDYSILRGNIVEIDCWKCRGLCWQKGIVRLLKKKEYQNYLVFAQTKDISTWIFGIVARLFFPNKRVFFWSHGYYGKERVLERRLKKQLFRLPNGGTFLYGDYARKLMIEDGLDPNKLYVIHNSLDYERQLEIRQHLHNSVIYSSHFGNENENLIFIGRLTTVKKLHLAIDALKRCHLLGKKYNMTFIGGGNIMPELQKQVEDLGLMESVWFYGPCYDEVVLGELIYNADLCISPGNVGLTAMHSMVFGTPVLTHNVFAHQMPEFEAIKPGETGCFFEKGSADSLSNTIIDWLSANSYRREEVRKACYNEIDKYWTPNFQISIIKQYIHE